MNGNYKIQIKVIDKLTGDEVGSETAENIHIANGILERAKGWLEKYDERNYKKCNQCSDIHNMVELSNPENTDLLVCQECLAGIMDGTITLNI